MPDMVACLLAGSAFVLRSFKLQRSFGLAFFFCGSLARLLSIFVALDQQSHKNFN